ncbi:hypothetical protein [Actinomadura litoris]|uniref:hypothetical protein n=1 Tax=Actinomadura litoris TaxID=2678616 RepID=UPI001FA6E7FE|nr:hypothetical protein [Actinomadura litoris]
MSEARDSGALLLRPDVYYTRSGDGLYMLTHDGPVIFGGSSVHPLLVRLAPYLNGRHSLAELTENLSGERREMVRGLLAALVRRGAIKQVPERDEEHAEDAANGRRDEVSFLGYFHDTQERAARAFRAYQDERALIVGAGRSAAAMADAARRSGIASVRVVEGGPVEDAGLVVHLGGPSAAEMERACAEAGADLVLGLVLDGSLWCAATGPRVGDGPGVTSIELRRAARRPEPAAPAAWDGVPGRVASAQLMHQVFRSLTGVGRPEPGTVTRLDPRTLARRTHTVVPHPFDPTSTPPAENGDARLDEDDFSRRAARLVDDHVGVFGPPAERDFVQLPLHVCEMEVSDPVGLLGPGARPVRATGAGLGFAAARLAAALAAFSAYGSLMIDPRRLTGPDGEPAFPGEDDPFHALALLRDGAWREVYVPGRAPASGRERFVRVARAFPALRSADVPFAVPPEIVSAYSRRDAVTAGVLACVRRLALDAAPGEAARVDVADVPHDPVTSRYLTILDALGEDVTLHRLGGDFPAPTVHCQIGASARGCASGLSMAGALRDALGAAILDHQSRLHGQPDYAPPPVPPLPADGPLRPTPAGRCDLDTVVAALAARGHEPVVVPLDHDPEVSAVMPYTVHVVMADA